MSNIKYLLAVLILIQFVTSHPVKEQIKFTVPSEWNLVPDQTGRLRLLHKSEIQLSDAEPFFNAETEVRFLLNTNKNPTIAQIFSVTDSLRGSYFEQHFDTYITIHGWQGGHDSEVNTAVRAAALNRWIFNFVTVDWSAGSGTLNYIDARNRIVDTARVVAQFIDLQVAEGMFPYSSLVLVGHSLGAHICGLVGKGLQLGIPPFIIGLDPAGPLFHINMPSERLDKGDANYVEVIHTAGGSLGIMDPIGDANFYPNGGRAQPGCGWDLIGTCAHGRSYKFYAESLELYSTAFWATKCSDIHELGHTCTSSGPHVRMGGMPPNLDNANGIYVLTTRSESPFALGYPFP